MSVVIKLKSRAADSTAPTTGNLENREVGISIPGKTIYINDAGTIKAIANFITPNGGAEASGTWPISITGAAGSTSKLDTARRISVSLITAAGSGTEFDGSEAVTIGVTGTLPATSGGTGQTGYAIGQLLYADTTTSLAKLSMATVGMALISGGNGNPPSWGKIGLGTHIEGILGTVYGGTGNGNGTVAKWTTARNLTIGATAKAVDGSQNVAWTIAEIGCAPISLNNGATTANSNTTLGVTHLNSVIEKTTTTAYSYTLAASLGVRGDCITVVNSGTAGDLTITRDTGVSLYQGGINGNVIVPPCSMVTLYRSNTSNRWIC